MYTSLSLDLFIFLYKIFELYQLIYLLYMETGKERMNLWKQALTRYFTTGTKN